MVGLRERSDDYLRIWILVRITRMTMTTTTMMRDTRRRLGFPLVWDVREDWFFPWLCLCHVRNGIHVRI
jgi:hypothetical protein